MTWNIRQTFAGIVTYKLAILFGLAIILIAVALFANFSPTSKITKDVSNLTNISNVSDQIINQTANQTINQVINYNGRCQDCHNRQLSVSGVDRDGCYGCHSDAHGSKAPSRYNDITGSTVHSKHSSPNTNQEICAQCHTVPSCDYCHSGHGKSILDINTRNNCQSCHGSLPDPRGHPDQRSTFDDSMHGWMGKCNTCHDQNKDKLGFKNFGTYNRSNTTESSLLCATCHSKQYDNTNHPIGVKENDRGKCVNCHNPHERPIKEGYLPKIGFSILQFIKDVGKVIGDNLGIVLIIIVFICSILFEYFFKPKPGNVILSKTLRVEHNKSKARAIKLTTDKPLNRVLTNINDILYRDNADLIGVSGNDKDIVIFVSIGGDKENKENLIKDLRSIEGISNVEYSDEYEVK